MSAKQLYRQTTVGTALTSTIEEYVADGRIPRKLADQVLEAFDARISKLLAHRAQAKVTFKGDKLIAYQYADNLWTFIVGGMELRDMRRTIDLDALDKVKIIAFDGTGPDPLLDMKDVQPLKNMKILKKM